MRLIMLLGIMLPLHCPPPRRRTKQKLLAKTNLLEGQNSLKLPFYQRSQQRHASLISKTKWNIR